MQIPFSDCRYPFQVWTALGEICLGRVCAFVTRTAGADAHHSWLCPPFVIGVAFDGVQGVFVSRKDLQAFLTAHDNSVIVMHCAPAELDIIHLATPASGVYNRVDAGRVLDTQLMHRLLTLGEAGHTSRDAQESTLARCSEIYLGVPLAEDVRGSDGKPIRQPFGPWLDRQIEDVDPSYLRNAAEAAIATFQIFRALRTRTNQLLSQSRETWGYVSQEWLNTSVRRFGRLSHHIQLKSAIVLRSITANGLRVDGARRNLLADWLSERIDALKDTLLREHDFRTGKKSERALQSKLRRLSIQSPHLVFPRTEAGEFATGADALADLRHTVPFVKRFLELQTLESLMTSFVDKSAKGVLHPQFDPLARTGRTTSFGDINAQNIPRDDAVRSCFVPSPGHVFIDADYQTIEMVTLAQACLAQFGWKSKMAEAINDGQDLHFLIAARVLGKDPGKVTAEERRKAKAINFGKPGGMGDAALAAYSKATYGAEMNPEEAAAFTEVWFSLFPEMRSFLACEAAVPSEIAQLLGLTPASYAEQIGIDRFGWLTTAGLGDQPLDTLGMMLLKAVKECEPRTKDGRPYSVEEVEYFFSRLETAIDSLPDRLRLDVVNRAPSKPLQRAVMGLVGKACVFTLTGRLRADASYTARHNTVFQGLAADGAKLALWRLWRDGYRIVNFIHDQVLVEVTTDSDLNQHADRIRELMVAGMREVVPDVRIDVEYAAMDRWHKDAKAVFDETGTKLLLWKPDGI